MPSSSTAARPRTGTESRATALLIVHEDLESGAETLKPPLPSAQTLRRRETLAHRCSLVSYTTQRELPTPSPSLTRERPKSRKTSPRFEAFLGFGVYTRIWGAWEFWGLESMVQGKRPSLDGIGNLILFHLLFLDERCLQSGTVRAALGGPKKHRARVTSQEDAI